MLYEEKQVFVQRMKFIAHKAQLGSFIAMLTGARGVESQCSHPVPLRFLLILSLCLCMMLWSLPFRLSDFFISSVRATFSISLLHCFVPLSLPLVPLSLSLSPSPFYLKTVPTPEYACLHVSFSIIQIKHCTKFT